VGILVSFIKFSSSGSNLVAFVRLKEIGMSDFLIAYIDFIYSSFQLVAGVLAGLYFKKKIGIRNTLILGLALCGIFSLTLTITTNQWVIFFTHALSGFGYGLTYNILIGVVMEPYAKNVREMTMGVYQTFFGLGIFFGDKIYAWMIDLLPDGISDYMMHIDVFTIITVITFATILLVLYLFRQSNRKFFENKSY
jgi:MFS family permease